MLWLYMIASNIWALYVMAKDKKRAKAGKRRIAERTLFTIAISGGAFGIWLGMYIFRHKTRKRAFVMGVPLVAALLLLVVVLICTNHIGFIS